MDSEELVKRMTAAVYDPNVMLMESYSLLKDSDITIPDASNPFMFLLENTSLLTSSALQSMEPTFRRTYPTLATTKEELYGHLNSDETNDIFSVPSSVSFNFYIGYKEALRYGKQNEAYTVLTIPKFSTIVVDEYTFTLLNDIKIYIYPNKSVFCKYEYNTSDISNNVDIILDSTIVTDSNNKEWIYLNAIVKQIRRYTFRETIMASIPYKNNIKLADREYYTYMKVTSINKQNNEFITLDTTYSNYIYNPNRPTIIVNPLDDSVNVELPIVYTLNGLVYSYLDFELYTTLGNLEIPMSKYTDLDYKFTAVIPDTTDESVIGINNVPIRISSTEYTFGGKNELSFLELKEKIINYATGDNTVPVTISEVRDMLSSNGFKYKRVENTILKNNILITKDIGNIGYDVLSNLDTIHNDTALLLNDVDSSKIKNIDNNKLIIEPYQLFKNIDGKLSPLSDVDKEVINDISVNDINKYNEEKIYFNLYKYIMDYEDNLDIRVYDVNSPSISEYQSLYTIKNAYTPFIINNYDIIYTGDGYTIALTVKSNPELDKLDISKMFAEVYLRYKNNEPIYYRGTFTRDTDNLYITFTIDVTSYIDKDDNIVVTGGYGEILSTSVNLDSICDITVYSTDTELSDVPDDTSYTVNIDDYTLIFHKEQFSISFGKRLDNLYTYYDIEYTDRKFSRYTEDIPMTYTKDVYQTDDDGTITIVPIDTDDDDENDDIEFIKLHSVGDIVYDEDGEIVYKYKAGDIIIDEETLLPVVNPLVGIIHKFPILLLEDVFLRTSSTLYRDYRISYFLELSSTINTQINSMNDKMLDNTKLKFIPDVSIGNVYLINNNITTTYSNTIRPVITIYLDTDSTLLIDEKIKFDIYNTLQSKLLDTTSLSDIENTIKEILPIYVLAVKVRLIEDAVIDIVNYTDDSSRFIIDKTLTYTDSKELIVVPNMKINVLTI